MTRNKKTPAYVVERRATKMCAPFIIGEMVDNRIVFSGRPYQHWTYDSATTEVTRLQGIAPLKHFRIMGNYSDHPVDRTRVITLGEAMDYFRRLGLKL